MTAALLVAAPASGQGKTTVAAGLARLHARRGSRVRCFKCGPDFIDPMWLAAASGHAVDPLDLWLLGEDGCARRLAAAAAEADLVIVEGVMGLYDGQPTAADLAQRFGLPVLAGIDATPLRGHSFHWSSFETPASPAWHTEAVGALGVTSGAGEPVYAKGSLRASWFHPWLPSSPRLAAWLFGAELPSCMS